MEMINSRKSSFKKTNKNLEEVNRNYRERYLLLIPALLLFVIFRYVPMSGIVLAWKQFNVALGLSIVSVRFTLSELEARL